MSRWKKSTGVGLQTIPFPKSILISLKIKHRMKQQESWLYRLLIQVRVAGVLSLYSTSTESYPIYTLVDSYICIYVHSIDNTQHKLTNLAKSIRLSRNDRWQHFCCSRELVFPLQTSGTTLDFGFPGISDKWWVMVNFAKSSGSKQRSFFEQQALKRLIAATEGHAVESRDFPFVVTLLKIVCT